jgi:hypothetical protein
MIFEPQRTQTMRIAKGIHEEHPMARMSKLILALQGLLMEPDSFLSGSPLRGALKRSSTQRNYSSFSLVKHYFRFCGCLRPSAVNLSTVIRA